jgi:hypothetical protein
MSVTDFEAIKHLLFRKKITMVVVGPEDPGKEDYDFF